MTFAFNFQLLRHILFARIDFMTFFRYVATEGVRKAMAAVVWTPKYW